MVKPSQFIIADIFKVNFKHLSPPEVIAKINLIVRRQGILPCILACTHSGHKYRAGCPVYALVKDSQCGNKISKFLQLPPTGSNA
jgi:hypothetical protein